MVARPLCIGSGDLANIDYARRLVSRRRLRRPHQKQLVRFSHTEHALRSLL